LEENIEKDVSDHFVDRDRGENNLPNEVVEPDINENLDNNNLINNNDNNNNNNNNDDNVNI
jgi:hypothetical protein